MPPLRTLGPWRPQEEGAGCLGSCANRAPLAFAENVRGGVLDVRNPGKPTVVRVVM